MKFFIRVLLAAVLLSVAPMAFAAPNTVVVVFNGNTEVNRHVYTFLGQVLSSAAGGGYKVVATLDPSSIKPGQHKAIIVVSTKVTTGVDPALAKFVTKYAAPQEIFLVALLARTNSMTVTPFAAADTPSGVDGVTAATTWSRGSQTLHNEWMQVLVSALAAR